LVSLVLVAVLLPGCCVSVTEPLSDPDKAEPDKRLEGKWENGAIIVIDSPAVKGYPKGLMRAVYQATADDPEKAVFWFFTTTIGKDTYATVYTNADFREEGAFKEWNERKDRQYWIYRYELDGDKVTLHGGNKEAMKKLMEAAKIEREKDYFKTPPGWLAKYLEKSGPQTLYDGANVGVLRRSKK
jgi:hypothetical protein